MSDPDPSDLSKLSGRMVDALEAIFGPASTDAVFSRPEHVGEEVVITAAAWERAGGFGLGGGGGTSPEGETGSGAGAGGGGASQGRPVAIIRIGPDRTEIRPVIDLTKLAVTLVLSALGVWRALRG